MGSHPLESFVYCWLTISECSGIQIKVSMQAKVSDPPHIPINETIVEKCLKLSQKWSQAHSSVSLHSSDSIPVLHSSTPVQHSSPALQSTECRYPNHAVMYNGIKIMIREVYVLQMYM